MDTIKKIFSILLLSVYLGYSFYYTTDKHYSLYFYIFIIYPTIRLIFDLFLLIYSIFNNNITLLLIEKISHGRVSLTTSWNKRLLGILKWFVIHLSIFLFFTFLVKGYL